MSLFPLIIYFLLGTSKQITIGAIAIVSLLTGEVIERMTQDYKFHYQNSMSVANGSFHVMLNQTNNKPPLDESVLVAYRITVACALSFLVGIVQIILGLSGLGIIASYFSDTFVSAYTCAGAFVVLTSQLKHILGIKNLRKFVGSFKIPRVRRSVSKLLF